MGCAQAKESHPNKHLHNNHQKTNRLPGEDSPQKGEVIKKKENEVKGKEQAKQVTDKGQNLKQNNENEHPTSREESKKVLNKSIEEKKSLKLLDDITKAEKGIVINVNLVESGISPNQTKLKNEGVIEEGQNIITEDQNEKSSSTIHFKKSQGTVKEIDISEDLKRNYRAYREEYIDDVRPGVAEKVEDHKKKESEKSSNGKLNHTTGQSNKNFSEKRINEISSKQPLTDNNLFYSQLKTSNNNKAGKEKDESQKENRGTEEKKKTSEEGSYFTEIIKDEKMSRNELEKKNDRSLKSGKIESFNKKNEYYSVLENKKGFEDRFKSPPINEKVNETSDDFMIEDHDQEGAVRPPLETSYHAPSKRSIESSKKEISSSNSRQTQKYLDQLPNSPITEGEELEMEIELSDKAMSSENRKQMNKFETAFFKEPSKNALQVTKENGITGDEEHMLPHNNLSSEISFKERSDSDEIPEEGNYANSLQISVHLTMVNHF